MNERRQLVVAAAGAVFVAMLFVLLVLKPKMTQLSETRTEIETLKTEEQTLKNNLSRLKDIQRDAPLAAAKLLAVQQALPSTADLPGFIRLVQDAASNSGTDLISIAPSQPSSLSNTTGVQSVGVTLVVNAGFHRLEDFLSRLENLKRVVEVNALSLSPSVDELSGGTTLQATLSLQMFVVQDGARVTGVPGSGAGTGAGAAASPSPSPTGSPR